MYHLSLPSDQLDPYAQEIVLTLSSVNTNVASVWLKRYVDFVKPTLSAAILRDAYVEALVEQDFARAWEWVRNWEFENDLESQRAERSGFEEQNLDLEDGTEQGAQAARLSRITGERERLLVVILDKMMKRKCATETGRHLITHDPSL
jgi:hypothetical protein